ncbi:MAG: M56 family metallopeptidase [Bacteroidota bacterium]
MNSQAIFMYVLKTILVAGIFLSYYWVALRNKKFHYYNRFYLLFSLVLSITIPLLNFKWITVDKPISFGSGEILNYIINAGGTSVAPAWNWIDWALATCILIAAGFLLAMVININKIYWLKRNSVVTKMEDIDFIDTEEDDAPFSYLKNLFWKRSISLEQEEGKKIFKHELTHIQQKHTWDRLFCQLLCSVLWVNPFYWIIQKELLTIHEFIADEEAIGNSGTESFAKMLLQTHYGDHFLQPTQSFFYSSIKRRLFMLTTSKNTRYSYLRRLIALPLLVLTMAIFSFKVIAKEENTITGNTNASFSKEQTAPKFKTVPDTKKTGAVKVLPPSSSTNKDKDPRTFTVVQEPAKFPGGQDAWQRFLRRTLNPDIIKKKGGPPGKYTVQLSFIVDKEGAISEVEALTDPGYGSKEDAIRVLSSGPKWIPATQNGKKVIYRNKQSITYLVSEK